MKRALSNRRSSTTIDQPTAKRLKTLCTRQISWTEQRGLGPEFEEVGKGAWPVLRIVDERKRKNKTEYLIEWRPHPITNEEFPLQWEPHSNVADDLIRQYNNQKKGQISSFDPRPFSRVNSRARRSRPIIPDSSENTEQQEGNQTDASLSPPGLESGGSSASAIEIAETQYPVSAESLLVNLPPLPKDTADYETLRSSQLIPSDADIGLNSPLIRHPLSSNPPIRPSIHVGIALPKSSRTSRTYHSVRTSPRLSAPSSSYPTQSSLSTRPDSSRRGSKLSKLLDPTVQRSEQVIPSSAQSLHSLAQNTLANCVPLFNSGLAHVSSSPTSARRSLRLRSPFHPSPYSTTSTETSTVYKSAKEVAPTQNVGHKKTIQLSNNSVIANGRRKSLRFRTKPIEDLSDSPIFSNQDLTEIMATPTPTMEVTTVQVEPVSPVVPIQASEKENTIADGALSQTNDENPLVVGEQTDPVSVTIHESIEEELPSSADTSQLLDSQINSSQESLNNERQVETVDGVMIPTYSIFSQNEYAIALPAEGKIKSLYAEIIKLKKKSILRFIQRKGSPGSSEISSKKTNERNEMQEMIQRLNDTVTHADLGLEPLSQSQSQHSLNSQGNASYAEYAGSKFVMLGCLIDRLKDKNCSLAIFTRPGELLELVFSYLEGKGVFVRKHSRSLENGTHEVTSGLTVDLLPTQSGEEVPLTQKPVLIVAFDVSFSIADLQLKKFHKQFGEDIPIVHFLVTNSSEHVERCVPETLTSNIRLKVVVRTTFLAAAHLGGDITYVQDESDRPADGRVMDMADFQRAVRKSPARKLALIADILAEAALSTEFQANWTMEGMPELKLSDLDTPPRASRAISRTPRSRTPRAHTPLSRAATPAGRKRFLEVDGENGTKRQRLTPVGDGISGIRPASEELTEARRQISDLITQLASVKAALAVAEQKQTSAEAQTTEWKESVSDLQRRFEKHSAETKQLRKESQKLNAAMTAMKERDEKSLNEKADLRRQISELKSELANTRNNLKSAGGDVAELEEARESARTATTKLTAMEKSLANTKSDLEFTRERYQDASKGAADSASQTKDLEAEIEKLKLAANDGKRALKAMNYETSLQKAFARAEQFKLEVKNRDAFIRKLQDENNSLKTRRGVQTRGSSVQPASSPAPRSRQASPAPGHLMPHSGSRASVLRNER